MILQSTDTEYLIELKKVFPVTWEVDKLRFKMTGTCLYIERIDFNNFIAYKEWNGQDDGVSDWVDEEAALVFGVGGTPVAALKSMIQEVEKFLDRLPKEAEN
ncbi:MAG: hypothetical protein ACYTEQ_01195 [Planctomycetota bacterium]